MVESTFIKRREYRSIVNLKVSPRIHQFAEHTLHLAAPLRCTDNIVKSLWIGPEHWLILSNDQSASEIFVTFNEALNGKTFNALDYTAALKCFEISGESAPRLMSALSSVDFRPNMFSVGACCRTKVARISGVVMREAQNQFLIFVDRSFEAYVEDLLRDTLNLLTNHPSA